MNRLDQIEARAHAATEGPWGVEPFLLRPGHPLPESEWLGVEATGSVKGQVALILLNDEEGDPDTEFIAHARTDVPDMAAALRAVLEIHQDGGESQGYLDDGSYGDMPHCCTECGSLGEYGVPWPCPTVEAITTALNGDDQ